MWRYLVCAWLGAVIGIGTLLLFQGANIHEKIMKDEREEK